MVRGLEDDEADFLSTCDRKLRTLKNVNSILNILFLFSIVIKEEEEKRFTTNKV